MSPLKLHKDEVLLLKLAIVAALGLAAFFTFAAWQWPL